MSGANKELAVGMLGCGVVGSQVARLLGEGAGEFTERAGAQLTLKKIAVRDINAKRDHVNQNLLTTDANSVVSDP